jgi:hypothetical protein
MGLMFTEKRIYNFTEPLKPWYNIAASVCYSSKVIQHLKGKVLEKGMLFDFPEFIEERHIKASKNNHHTINDTKRQVTLATYV